VLQRIEPTCTRCGSGTGVLGNIGQGPKNTRPNEQESAQADQTMRFQCLTCGDVSTARVVTFRPECQYCGSKSGVLVDVKS